MEWLDAPPRGTRVSGGFDGSDSDDWSAIKLETIDGLLFTPRSGIRLRGMARSRGIRCMQPGLS